MTIRLRQEALKPKRAINNQGKLIINATCAPTDIRYPTDLSLLNEAREKTEAIIDRLYEPRGGEMKKRELTGVKHASNT